MSGCRLAAEYPTHRSFCPPVFPSPGLGRYYPTHSFIRFISSPSHFLHASLLPRSTVTPPRAARLWWSTRRPPPYAQALFPLPLFPLTGNGSTAILTMICRQILTQLTLTDAAFVCPGAFTGFEYIFTHWNKRRTYETHQQLSLGLVYTHSLWKKLNCYLDMYTLLVIGGIELNPGPARNEYSKHISIAHVNINSITAIGKLQELENFVDVNQISILSLTETKLDDTVSPSLYTIDNFHPPLTKHRDRHGGGTAIYIHKSLTFSRIPSLELPGEEWIWVKIKVNNITFIICSIYLPPHPAAQRQE